MSKREQLEKIDHALKEVDALVWDLYDENRRDLARRADTIIGKLLDLQDLIERK